ncbi:MAG TPA: hypothetical protein VEU76_04590 [Candidatus Udaeobacter sp.]|nr:hypothetical protein [Candidatus Udaeobacter sp.]
MPEIPRRPSELFEQHPWIWGVAFGFVVAATILLVSAAEHGVRASNVLLAVVVFIGFGLLGVIGVLVRRYTPGGPV